MLGGQITTMRELIDTLGRVSGRKAPKRALPTSLMKAMTPLGPVVGKVMNQGPNLRELISSADNVTFWARHDKAMAELDYSPRGLEQGLRDTLQAEGKLTGAGTPSPRARAGPREAAWPPAQWVTLVLTSLRSDSLTGPFSSSVLIAARDVLVEGVDQRAAEVELHQGAHHLHVLGVRRHRVGGHHPAPLRGQLEGDVELVVGVLLGEVEGDQRQRLLVLADDLELADRLDVRRPATRRSSA